MNPFHKQRLKRAMTLLIHFQLAIELSLALKRIKNHFKNYCKVIQKRTGISYYWSIDNSHEFIKKKLPISKLHIVSKRLISPRFIRICHWMLFMIV